jgi:ribosomal protein S18 acetylase RimI-like enzyme
VEIRPTTEADGAAIIAIVAQGGVFTSEESEAVEQLLDYYYRTPVQDEYLFITAEEAGQVLGFACYGRIALTQKNYELNWIASDQRTLRKGAGTSLLRAVEDLSRERGGRFLNLETSTTEPYAAARAFYDRHGYYVVAQIPDYYADGDGMLIYRKVL